ncbi:MAG: YihY/virulence factor BrkB family protein [Microcella sp.]|uniref:YihY/virulence factor BrkB family protein n=1 Tax=Microcella sp. TaxID=1913979 RepID=UPI0033159379
MHEHPDSRDDAPEPGDERKPSSPTDIRPRVALHALRRAGREFIAHQSFDIAAALTFFSVLAVFPALIAVFSILGFVGQGTQSADAVLRILERVSPQPVVETLRGPIEQLATSPGAGLALVVGLVLAVWTASGYVSAFSRAMNRIYAIEEGRPFWKLKPLQVLITLVGLVVVVVMVVGLVVSGPLADAIGDALGVEQAARTAWSIARWPVLAVLLVIVIALLYYATPNARQPRFRWLSPGAAIAIVALVIVSLGFGFYVSTVANYSATYGALGGVVVFLLWLWLANMALLFGAEVDAELERARELQAGLPAEKVIQLPPRDDTMIEKRAQAARQQVDEARRLRSEATPFDER